MPFWLLLVLAACRPSYVGKTKPCSNGIQDSSSAHPMAFRYQAILNKYHKDGLPGAAVLIEDEYGVWMGSAGKADLDRDIDFKPCTVSKVASITKMLFAAAVMQLSEAGKIDLNDRASEWLDEDIVRKVENLEHATLLDLLYHRTGIYDIITDDEFYLAVLNSPNKKWTGRELIRFAYNKPAVFEYVPAGSKGTYSNTNTLLLSMCVEGATGRPHHEWLREMVLNKAGMVNSVYHTHEELPEQTAQGYYDLYNNGTLVNVSNLITGSGNGYGGVYSNVIDLHRFMRAMFIDKTLVSPQSLDLMQTFIEDDELGNLGAGLLQQYKNLSETHMGIGHSGRDLGYSGDAHYFPTRGNRIFVHLVNYGTNGKTALRDVYDAMREEFAKEMMR